MPLIQLETSCDLSGQDKKQLIVKTLSRLAAEGTGKSERYVMASVRDKVTMTLSGHTDSCALVTIKAIGGLSQAVNQTLTEQITEALENELAIPQKRIYLTFEELAPTHWGWNGKTFG
ncbi:MAG: tautomerase family protein [Phycisphaerales bacterium]|nr:MAG: tautomerase family protein [Phycisphaerales bacterium]